MILVIKEIFKSIRLINLNNYTKYFIQLQLYVYSLIMFLTRHKLLLSLGYLFVFSLSL